MLRVVSIDLGSRRVLVTGGSMGLGLEVCRELVRLGARVVIVGRGQDALEAALAELGGSGHECLRLDVSDAAAWPAAMAQIDRGGELHGLVTAAGVLGPIGSLDSVPADEFAATIAINVIGTALALQHALPRLRTVAGRAVTFSGGGGTGPLARYDAYAASKAAVVRLTENVAADGAIELNCVAPGFVATRMHEGTLAAGPDCAGAAYFERTREQLAHGGFPASEAAELVAFLLSPQAAGITGRLLSAQWDPWRDEQFCARLRDDPDLARLRRIDDQFYVRAS
jgi:NAD(P)-dependent dehydrogenase (short-subunit alcohol dehydrogenase family)